MDDQLQPLTENLPAHNHTVNTFIVVDGAADFIDFLVDVFDGQEHAAVRTPDRDGTLIHAEVVVGDSTIMIGDRKPDWPFTPALTQVYVHDVEEVLARAERAGSTTVTPRSEFYGGYDLARFLDPWHNLWWLYAPSDVGEPTTEMTAETDWHDAEPSVVYTTLMRAMADLAPPRG